MNLTDMYLQNNKLASFPESFKNLDSLVNLRIDNTYLSEFPSQTLQTDESVAHFPAPSVSVSSLSLWSFTFIFRNA